MEEKDNGGPLGTLRKGAQEKPQLEAITLERNKKWVDAFFRERVDYYDGKKILVKPKTKNQKKKKTRRQAST